MTTITLPRATVQRALDAYELFRDADAIDALDDAMLELTAALEQPQAEQHTCDAHAVCSKCGAQLWTPGQLAAAKGRAAEYSDWFMGREKPQADHDELLACMVAGAAATADRTGVLEALLAEARGMLWVLTEHNALHFGERHNTVIDGRGVIASIDAALGKP